MEWRIPDPAVVVLVGAAGSGKSSWARENYRAVEVISSDELRAIVGSGPNDLNASADAFQLFDDILAARSSRQLTCVLDTLGLDASRRREYLAAARRNSVPAVAVIFDVPAAVARDRNSRRERPVPAAALAAQLARLPIVRSDIESEGWDLVVEIADDRAPDQPIPAVTDRRTGVDRTDPFRFVGDPGVILQLSRFDWGDDPREWLKQMALAADTAGFSGIAVMDHLIQIPQVDRAWSPIPEAWVTLGMLAALDTRLHLGILVSPVTFRHAGVTAKAAATLNVLTGGRAFLGLGAGWWEREHAAFGLPFPAAGARVDALEAAIETIRALWSSGTRPYHGTRVRLPETTCYPRPISDVPIIVGGRGRRTLSVAARLADGCNVSSRPEVLASAMAEYYEQRALAGRGRESALVTVLDLPIVGRDRDQVWHRVELFRGRTSAAQFARSHNAAVCRDQRERYLRLGDEGVHTIFVSPLGIRTPDDVLELSAMLP
jgi:alkanesulfonate monooxygenase SsuD/methylene tetrahydromethanopterin reductase-like flavin-dependent oxidoreductase (luciferase family)/predicted kinase